MVLSGLCYPDHVTLARFRKGNDGGKRIVEIATEPDDIIRILPGQPSRARSAARAVLLHPAALPRVRLSIDSDRAGVPSAEDRRTLAFSVTFLPHHLPPCSRIASRCR